MKIDIYQEITDKIIVSLENGQPAWVKPWACIGQPRNAITGRGYNGINLLLLGMSDYTSQAWLTYKQAADVGGQVRKGELGTKVVLYKPFVVKDVNAPVAGTEKSIPMMRAFTVFNTQQIDGLPTKYTEAPKPLITDFMGNAAADTLLSLATIQPGKPTACFIPSKDVIQLPERTHFKSEADYYATALHELTHWTGHKSRLARTFGARFGDNAYAFEELVAELGAAFSCAHCGINGQLQHAAYIKTWLAVLRKDKKAIFTAAAAARKAVEYVQVLSPPADLVAEA